MSAVLAREISGAAAEPLIPINGIRRAAPGGAAAEQPEAA